MNLRLSKLRFPKIVLLIYFMRVIKMTEIVLQADEIKLRRANIDSFFTGLPENEVLKQLQDTLMKYLDQIESLIDESEGNQ